jgi:death on curing protein
VPVYHTLRDVLDLHTAAMEATGSEPQPVRSMPGVESALMRGQTAGYYDGHDVTGQAARIATGISRAQGFLDGNKRTALAVTAVFLDLNGQRLTGDMLAGAALLDALADPSVSDDAADSSFEAWLREHTTIS